MTAESAKQQPITPKQILVVDDQEMVAETIRMLLTISGHKVDVAKDGEEALAMFGAGKYDLVVTDLSLPRMDGFELAAAIKERSPAQPIILITAHAESIKADKERLSKVDFVMGKPFSVEQIREVIAKIFVSG
jgi:CheY-like chemotaxis protein